MLTTNYIVIAQTNVYDEYLCASNENILLSFRMRDSNKTMSVLIANDESYIVYRYGTRSNIELEFPENKADSWTNFTYYHEYYIGGHDFILSFENGGFIYDIRDQHYKGGERTVQIEITNISNNRKTYLVGVATNAIGFLGNIIKYNVNSGGSTIPQ
jgi:hypothetical protein